MSRYLDLIFGEDGGFYCETCQGRGSLLIEQGRPFGECICPTCHGECLGMSLEEFFERTRRENDDPRE
jgi:hypothetical protein